MNDNHKFKETLLSSKLKDIYDIDLPDDSPYYLSETSGTDGNKKTIFVKTKSCDITFKTLLQYAKYDGDTNVVATVPSVSIYATILKSVLDDKLIASQEINELIKIVNNNEAKYIFSVPSFIWNFKDLLKINKEQVLMLTGEVVSDNLKQYLIDNNITCYEFFGANEYNLMGAKKLEDEYYDFLLYDIKINNNELHSPYLAPAFIKDEKIYYINKSFVLNDVFEVKNRKFKFLSRASAFAKINGNAVSIVEINKVINGIKEIEDYVVFKTNNENEPDELAMVYIGDIDDKKIKDIILNHFNDFNYLPKKIKKTDMIPIAGYGKKDMAILRQWMK